jgi:hypothetical protein
VPEAPAVDDAVVLLLAEAVGLEVAELRLSFSGDEPAKTTKYTMPNATAASAKPPARTPAISPFRFLTMRNSEAAYLSFR